MISTTLYGIPNCDTVKKARRWLDEAGIAYQFHDFRRDGLSADWLADCLQRCPIDQFVNRRSTSWRQLDDTQRQQAEHIDTLIPLLQANPTLIKRPVLQHADRLHTGFDAPSYQEIFQK